MAVSVELDGDQEPFDPGFHGLGLYWIGSDGLNPNWITSPYGLTITLGGVAALAGFAVAVPLVAMTKERYAELKDRELTEEDATTIEGLYDRLRTGEQLMSGLLTIAVLAMGIAQYV